MTKNEANRNNNLKAYIDELTAGETTAKPETESWEAMMERITAAYGPTEIDEETYFWFLEVLPPRFMQGSYFCFAEGMEPLRLFWRRGSRHFVRFLDWQQTKNFCRLADIPDYQ